MSSSIRCYFAEVLELMVASSERVVVTHQFNFNSHLGALSSRPRLRTVKEQLAHVAQCAFRINLFIICVFVFL
ncbi:hypothetical protein BC835DRAFT_1380860 [Cytidiella melzeri]|nr:hypothetical protein BC835DRAFT_1380860 [Cytidiella melzeri]